MVVISRYMCSVGCTVVEMAHESSILQRATREVSAYAYLSHHGVGDYICIVLA